MANFWPALTNFTGQGIFTRTQSLESQSFRIRGTDAQIQIQTFALVKSNPIADNCITLSGSALSDSDASE